MGRPWSIQSRVQRRLQRFRHGSICVFGDGAGGAGGGGDSESKKGAAAGGEAGLLADHFVLCRELDVGGAAGEIR